MFTFRWLSLILCFYCCWYETNHITAVTPVDPKDYKKYSKPNFNYGLVAIVLARGRSGSSFLCRLIENVEGVTKRIQDGLFGSDDDAMKRVQNASLLLMTQLQRRRETHPDGSLIGIKWKPYVLSPTFEELFDFIARMSFPVIFMHRNPLDEFISRSKHNQEKHLNSHCKSKECALAAQHEKLSVNISQLQLKLLELPAQVVRIRNLLDDRNVRYMELNYEDLAFGDDTSRKRYLQSVIDFLALGKHAHMKYFHTEIYATNSYNQSLMVRNYEEVVDVVSSMSMSDLLHP